MTSFNFRRISRKGIERIRRGLFRSWKPGGTHRERCQNGEIDADTMRSRALHDRMGKLVASGIAIYYSTSRTNQFDLFINGEKRFTGGAVALSRWIRDTLCLQSMRASVASAYEQTQEAQASTTGPQVLPVIGPDIPDHKAG